MIGRMTRGFGRGCALGAATAALLATAAAAQAPAAGPAASRPAGEVLASLPGDRMENVFEAADGSLYFTATFGNKVWRRSRDGKLSVFFATPNPQGVIETPKGMVVDWQERLPDFSTGRPTFIGLGARLALLDRTGKVVKTLSGIDDRTFFNGMAGYGPSRVFISDDGGDRILEVDLDAGKVEVWLDSDRTHDASVPPAGGGGPPSAPNGMKVRDGWVYFSRGDVYKVKIGRDGKAEGSAVLAAKTGGTDDFDVAADGTIYASHGSDILKASPAGAVQTFLAQGCPFCTATRISRDGRFLYFTGGSIPGRPGAPAVPGYVSRVPLN